VRGHRLRLQRFGNKNPEGSKTPPTRKAIRVYSGTVSNNAVSWFRKYSAQFRLAFRIALAGVLAYILCRLAGLRQTYPAVLSAVIVMQGSVGASLKAVLDRFLGSLGGAFWAALVMFAIRPLNLPIGWVLIIVLVPVALLAGFKPAYRAAPTTAVILLLVPGNIEGPMASAIQRMFGVGFGSVAAFVVALLVFPAGTRGNFAEAAGRAVSTMAELAAILFNAIRAEAEPKTVQALHDSVRKAIHQAEAAAEEVARERTTLLSTLPDTLPMCRTLRRIRNDLAMIGRVTSERLPEWIQEGLKAPGDAAGDAVSHFLTECSNAISLRRPAPSLETCRKELAQLETAITNLRWIERARQLSDADVGRLFGFVFSLEQLDRNLTDLVDRINELAAKNE